MISLHGARLHNLQGVDAQFPKNAITVVCGPSGCGKSSLAFDTLHGECKRRYLETLSPFALRILGGKRFIPLDSAEGLIPSVSFNASKGEGLLRATALSLSETDHSFHTLFAHFARPTCPICGRETEFFSREEMVSQIAERKPQSRLQFFSPIEVTGKTLRELSSVFLSQGYSRAIADGKLCQLADLTEKEEEITPKDFKIVVDRIILREGVRTRISEAVDSCLSLTRNFFEVEEEGKITIYSLTPRCPNGHKTNFLPELDASLFSPYSFKGACPTCKGSGRRDDKMDDDSFDSCRTCNGLRLREELLQSKVGGKSYAELIEEPFEKFAESLREIFKEVPESLSRVFETLFARLNAILELGLGYLSPARSAATLSSGEAQRLRLIAAVSGYLDGMLFCLDEPASGLHKKDALKLWNVLEKIKNRGNTLVLMEHHPEIISRADWIIEMGPSAGKSGGRILFQGPRKEVLSNPTSPTAAWLRRLSAAKKHFSIGILSGPTINPSKNQSFISVRDFSKFGIRPICADFPLGKVSVITGPSGSGKSTLLFHYLAKEAEKNTFRPLGIEALTLLSSGSFHGSKKSSVASAIQILEPLRQLFSSLPESKIRGYGKERFGFHTPGGRCETCKGEGTLSIPGGFEETECPICLGKRFRDEILEIRFKSLSIADVLSLTVEMALKIFDNFPAIRGKLSLLEATGLGYLTLGQSTAKLSGGERARLRLSAALYKTNPPKTLYLFDEPARGLHETDIQKLLELFKKLASQGHTVIAVEHALDFSLSADYVLSLE